MSQPNIIVSLRYRDAFAAIDWLERTLGFVKKAVFASSDGNSVEHAELTFGAGMVMLGSVKDDATHIRWAHPSEFGDRQTHAVWLYTPECDALYARAVAAGAEVVQPLTGMSYGGKNFALRDAEGYVWSAGSYDPWAQA